MRAPTHSLGVLAGIVIALLFGTAVWAAYPVGGAIRTHYCSLGGESGRLGEPTGPERCGLRDAGCVQSFDGGSIHWTRAVDGTQSRSGDTVSSARVITHDGRFIDALYSSSSGGTTNRAADVWGNDVPYLQERDDSAAHTSAAGNPYSSWSATITQDAMRRAFGLPDVVDISLTRTGSGMVDTVTATSADGRTAALSGVEARTVLGLRSATFEIAD